MSSSDVDDKKIVL